MEDPTKGYAVVFYATPDSKPEVCDGYPGLPVGEAGERTVAVYDTMDEAIEEWRKWPSIGCQYGIVPSSVVIDKVETVSYRLKSRP